MFDITAVEYSGINSIFIIAFLIVSFLFVAIASLSNPFSSFQIISVVLAIASFVTFFVLMDNRIDGKTKIYENNLESNISAIENTGVTVLDKKSADLSYAFSSADSVTEVTLKTEEGNLLTCKIVTDSKVKTFDVQCLDPNTTDAFIDLDEAIKVS